MNRDEMIDRFQRVVELLLKRTSASRTTLRLDLPDAELAVDRAAAEAVRPTVRSIRTDVSLKQRELATVKFLESERRTLVQNDVLVDSPPAPRALIDSYGVRAQILGPVIRNEALVGWISVHQVGETRVWSGRETQLLDQAVARVLAILDKDASEKLSGARRPAARGTGLAARARQETAAGAGRRRRKA